MGRRSYAAALPFAGVNGQPLERVPKNDRATAATLAHPYGKPATHHQLSAPEHEKLLSATHWQIRQVH